MPRRDLLIEIGVEEIPASYIEPALADFEAGLTAGLSENRIPFESVARLGTPRRLALLVNGVEEEGEPQTIIVTGPPKKAGFDAEGKPTKAALGFASSQGMEVADLRVVNTAKGDYLTAEKHLAGRKTTEFLGQSLPGIVASLTFPKSMRWGDGEFKFVRPIHWLVVLFGPEVVEIELAGLISGRTTFGHRFMAPEPIELGVPGDYRRRLKKAHVWADPGERRDLTRRVAREAAEGGNGSILEDEGLVGTNTNLVELPSAICGEFDDEFLDLPDEVLITAMKEHQKYFAVTDAQGRLRPLFVAINNTLARDPEVVKKGHQRVLRARLADAAFFYKEDTKKPLESRIEDLKGIVYHKQLGTSYQKVERFARLAEWLAGRLAPEYKDKAVKAAWLSKTDLVTSMVGEFPTLQGIIGRAYALEEGLDPELAEGIKDHYLPDSAEAALPESTIGALVGLADKMDTIAGMFAINKTPTGGTDPFGLRRAALGIIRILIDRGWSPSLAEFTSEALDILPAGVFKLPRPEAASSITGYFRGRMLNLFTGQGFDHDVVDAVLEAHQDDPAGALKRIAALQEYKKSDSFVLGAIAFKRLFNILKGQQPADKADPSLFETKQETALFEAAESNQDAITLTVGSGDFASALSHLTGLRQFVDDLFDEVMVMAEDETLRANRLALVNQVASLFRHVADFSRLQTG